MFVLKNTRAITRKLCVISVLTVLLTSSLTIESVWCFDIPNHRNATKEVLETITAEVNGRPKNFSQRALEQIADANENVDFYTPARFSPKRHFTNEKFVDSSIHLFELQEEIIERLTANPPDGNKARKLLGEALHGIQDFYSHSNWVELGNREINMLLGRATMINPPSTLQACPVNPFTLGPGGGGGLTSAYYIGNPFTGCGDLPFPGKCHHGNYTDSCKGINKDKPDQGPPGMHAIAVTVARAATRDFVELILSDHRIAGNDKAISALLDLKGTIGFVIDDTGSMGEEIDGVKSTIARIVAAVEADPSIKPDNYLLVRFGDPDVGQAFVTDSADELLSAVSSLSPNGGGDCPELSQAALIEALDKADPNSRLYLFTDAGAKDSSRRNEVISRAREKTTRITYSLTGTCSPVDEAYIRGAAETGGQLFLLNQFETPQLFDLIKPQLPGDLETILSSSGELAKGPRVFSVPVDSTVRQLTVSVSIDTRTSISLRRPSGVLVTASDPDARITDITSGRIITINQPNTGTWLVEIAGAGKFSVVAEGNSLLEFRDFDFVRPNPDIHGGFFPIPGQPIVDTIGTGEATILGASTTTAFKLVSVEGETIKNINLVRNFPNASPDHYIGMFNLPNIPFKIVATGNDSSGFQYQRTFPTIYRAQVVGVEVELGSGAVEAGRTTTLDFVVKNLGSLATFKADVVSSLGSITRIDPTLLTLKAGDSGKVQYDISIPSSTPIGTSFTVTITATKVDDTSIFNSAILNLTVEGKIFDVCLQDDSTGDKLQLNLTTGDYEFTRCSPGGFTLTGTGTLSIKGSVVSLQHNAPDRRVLAKITNSPQKGTASIQVLSQGATFTITDRNTTNNTCACP